MSDHSGPYGLPYKGSKNQLAQRIVSLFPSGETFCDCCCGGGAILHASALSGKFKYVHGYDCNKSIVRLLQGVLLLGGMIDYNFRPFVGKEEFKKSIKAPNPTLDDCLTKYSCSFGYEGNTFCFGEKDIPLHEMVHNMIMSKDYKTRRKYLLQFANVLKGIEDYTQIKKALNKAVKTEQIRNLARIEQVQSSFENCETKISVYEKSLFNIDYKNYDVIYFDPPYKGTNINGYYQNSFDYDRFTQLLKTLNTLGKRVFVSEYDLKVTGYEKIAEYNHTNRINNEHTYKTTECVFSNCM